MYYSNIRLQYQLFWEILYILSLECNKISIIFENTFLLVGFIIQKHGTYGQSPVVTFFFLDIVSLQAGQWFYEPHFMRYSEDLTSCQNVSNGPPSTTTKFVVEPRLKTRNKPLCPLYFGIVSFPMMLPFIYCYTSRSCPTLWSPIYMYVFPGVLYRLCGKGPIHSPKLQLSTHSLQVFDSSLLGSKLLYVIVISSSILLNFS